MSNYLTEDARLIRSHVPTGADPPADSDYLFILYAVLLRAKGLATTAEDVHDAWSAWMTLSNPSHESVAPYSSLSSDTRDEDEPYLEAIRSAAKSRQRQ